MAGGGRYVARTAANQVYIYTGCLGRQALISLGWATAGLSVGMC